MIDTLFKFSAVVSGIGLITCVWGGALDMSVVLDVGFAVTGTGLVLAFVGLLWKLGQACQ